MNDEITAQLQFFRDIGVETLDLSVVHHVETRVETMKDAQPQPASSLTLESIRAEIGDCQRCKLAPTRTNIVFGSGNPNAELVFVGEAPGSDEDQQGLPFVGRAGQLLTKIIESINIKREDVYICNVLKCRPPENRNPEPDEVASCNPFLRKQLAVIRPFRNRDVEGFVVRLRNDAPSDLEILEIRSVIDPGPFLRKDVFELCQWISNYYVAPIGEVLNAALPAGLNTKRRKSPPKSG